MVAPEEPEQENHVRRSASGRDAGSALFAGPVASDPGAQAAGEVDEDALTLRARQVTEEVLSHLGELPAGMLFLRVQAASVTVRNIPVTLWRGEGGQAAGEPALKLVFEDESSVNLSNVTGATVNRDGRVVITGKDAELTLGPRPW